MTLGVFAVVLFEKWYQLLNLAVPAGSPFHVSAYWVTLIGKIMCYAIVALAMNLVWGYAGILSLGHGLFFALGGYAFGMYLMRQIGADGQYQADVPDFAGDFLDWKGSPGMVEQRPVLVVRVAGGAGAGPARFRVRLLAIPLARARGFISRSLPRR